VNASRAWFEKDFYRVLGVAETATAEEIKRAYKKLARENHPDRNPGDTAAEDRMKDASEAYDVLSDAAKRQEYDQMRNMKRSGYAGGSNGNAWSTHINFDDLPFDLGSFFGGAGRQRPRRGADVEARARIPLRDAMRGTTVTVRHSDRDVTVKVPAGVEDGARLRVRDRGAAGAAGPGDLFVRVEVEPDPVFGRRGKDLTTSVHVPFTDAALGTTVKVPTLDGTSTMKVPAGTQPGTTLRMRGKGGPTGDLLVTINVDIPAHLTDEERELIERLAALRATAKQEAGS
jgi:molecular chaperone DnaJ